MSEDYQKLNNLKISKKLLSFVNDELLSDTNISADTFWSGFEKVVHELAPMNRKLIQIREELQKKLTNGILKIKEIKLILKNTRIF